VAVNSQAHKERFLRHVRKRYDLYYEWNKELASVVRAGMLKVKNDAKALARSKKLRGLAKTVTMRVRASKTERNRVRAFLGGSGWFNIWIHGRKPYDVVPENRKALKVPEGFAAKAEHKHLEAPRPVLMPAWRGREAEINKQIAERMAEVTAKGLSRVIDIKLGKK